MDWTACEVVEIVPCKVSGIPLPRGSRVPVDPVIERNDRAESVEEITYKYILNAEDIRAMLSYRAGR